MSDLSVATHTAINWLSSVAHDFVAMFEKLTHDIFQQSLGFLRDALTTLQQNITSFSLADLETAVLNTLATLKPQAVDFLKSIGSAVIQAALGFIIAHINANAPSAA